MIFDRDFTQDKVVNLVLFTDGMDNDSTAHETHRILELLDDPGVKRFHLYLVAVGSPSEINEPLLKSLFDFTPKKDYLELVISHKGDAVGIKEVFEAVRQRIQQRAQQQVVELAFTTTTSTAAVSTAAAGPAPHGHHPARYAHGGSSGQLPQLLMQGGGGFHRSGPPGRTGFAA